MDWNTILFLLVSILGLAYYLIQKKYSYWSDRGVPSLPVTFPYGNLKGAGSETSLGERIADCYRALKGKGVVGGLYFFISPTVLIYDLDLLKHIFVKDFSYFQNRGIYVNEKADPLSAHLFSIEGSKWRNMRSKLSPTFTSGKMKMMHTTFLVVAEQFKAHLEPIAAKGQEVEIKDILARFTTDIIANVAFGVDCDSLKDPNNAFRETGKMIFNGKGMPTWKRLIIITFPKLGKLLNVAINSPEVSKFFMKLVRETVDHREKNNIQRNDFMSLLLQIKNTGKLDGEEADLGGLTVEQLAAQTFLFFLAGFETSSSTMTFATYELALNQELQDKVREEIRETLARHDGKMTYEAAMEMTYLEQVIQETLRKYPIVTVLRRKVNSDYKIPNSNIILEKDLSVQIPVFGIHRDPEIYPEPEKFDPERFTKENIAARHPMAWLPFGEGPRNCVGLRFGMLQTKVGLATILNSYRLIPSEHTPVTMKIDPKIPVLSPKGGMFLRIEKV